MSSVANRKYTDMRQIEFQQNGSSRVTAMLTQPLLENSSTYMCEVTDFECSMGEELAFPEDQWLFSIVARPNHNGQAGCDFHLGNFEKHMDELARIGPEARDYISAGVFGIVDNEFEPGVVEDATGVVVPLPVSLRESYTVFSRRYYSMMDFVYDVSQQLKVIDREIALRRNLESIVANTGGDPNLTDWTDFEEEEWHDISLTFDSGGRLQFNLKASFMSRYMVYCSPLFQQVTGFPLFIGEWAGPAGTEYLVKTLADYYRAHEGQYAGESIYTLMPAGNPAGVDMRTEVRDMIPIQEGIDVRKKIIVEVSLPISHTLAWDGVRESTRYVLQEFNFPSELLDLSFENTGDFRTSKIRFKERGLHGQVLFLNGGSNLAIKKLNEGQMQAFRIDVLVERDRWDVLQQKFVREKRNLEMGVGGFFYLKLLFTKETI